MYKRAEDVQRNRTCVTQSIHHTFALMELLRQYYHTLIVHNFMHETTAVMEMMSTSFPLKIMMFMIVITPHTPEVPTNLIYPHDIPGIHINTYVCVCVSLLLWRISTTNVIIKRHCKRLQQICCCLMPLAVHPSIPWRECGKEPAIKEFRHTIFSMSCSIHK